MTKCVSQRLLIATTGFVLLVITGCGGGGVKLTEVKGTVTVDGQPVQGLEVSFEPQGVEGGSSLGYTQADGTYELHYPGGKTGAVIGTHTVRVVGSEMDEGGVSVKIPPKYNTQTELTFEVKSGSNTYDIPITTK